MKTEPALVFADKEDPRDWRVEWFDEDGGCEVTVFYGPQADERARAFAKSFYGSSKTWKLPCAASVRKANGAEPIAGSKRTELVSDDVQLGSYPRCVKQGPALHLPDRF